MQYIKWVFHGGMNATAIVLCVHYKTKISERYWFWLKHLINITIYYLFFLQLFTETYKYFLVKDIYEIQKKLSFFGFRIKKMQFILIILSA